jgi:hypothetical protein
VSGRDNKSGNGDGRRNTKPFKASGRGAFDSAFQLLRALPRTDHNHQPSDVTRLTGIARPSVYRLVARVTMQTSSRYRDQP